MAEEHLEQAGVSAPEAESGRDVSGLRRYLLCGAGALLTSFALSVDLSALPFRPAEGESALAGAAAVLNDLMGAVDGEQAVFLVLVPALLLLYHKLLKREGAFLPSAAVVAALFSREGAF